MNCNCNAKTFNTDAHAFNCPCRRDVVRYSTIAGTFEGDTLDEAKAASDEIKAAWIDAKDIPAELERVRKLGFVPAGENCTCDNCSCKDDPVEPEDQELPMPESVESFTDEDRARLEALGQYVDCEVALRALAHINHLEAALEAADELAKACDDLAAVIEPEMKPVRMRMAVDIYRSARASMKGEK